MVFGHREMRREEHEADDNNQDDADDRLQDVGLDRGQQTHSDDSPNDEAAQQREEPAEDNARLVPCERLRDC